MPLVISRAIHDARPAPGGLNEYGLAAAVWTTDIKKALRTAQALRAGIVWINDSQPAPTEMPWGGYKQSGVGRELGKDGLDDFLERKSVYVNLG